MDAGRFIISYLTNHLSDNKNFATIREAVLNSATVHCFPYFCLNHCLSTDKAVIYIMQLQSNNFEDHQ